MINELKNVPELRFSNFCDEWVNYKLGEIVDIRGRIGFRGYTKSDIINKEDGGVLTFSPTNIIYNKLKNTVHDTYITKEKYEESPEIMVKTGDILFVKTGSTLGKSTLVANLNEEATVNPQIVVMRVKVFFHQKFTSTYLTLNKILRQVAQTRIGGAIPTLTESEIKKFQVSFPVYEEQQKIGEFFSKLDRQIELEEQKLEKLEEQKKGYMQKTFSKELRFKDENGNNYPEWEEKNLKELIDVRDGTHESPKPSKDGYLLVTSKNLKNSKLDLSESYFISKENYESINQRSKVEIGDILFGMIGTIGNPILLEECDFAIKNVALLKTNDLLEKYYILNFLKSSNISKQFYRMNAGGTQKFIALSTIRDLNIDMPSSEEAIKIGNFFNKVDNLIENQSNKLELLKKRKQGFLQKMFV